MKKVIATLMLMAFLTASVSFAFAQESSASSTLGGGGDYPVIIILS